MEIKITTSQVLKVLQVLSWVIFIGLCIEAGGTAINTIITMFINPQGVENFWEGADYLSSLYNFDQGHFFAITLIMTIVAVLKAFMFYLIIKLFIEKKLTIAQPFNIALRQFIVKQSYLALGIGLFSYFGSKYAIWLTEQGLPMANLESLHIAGADVWLFMVVILFVIVQVVKRGIEIQSEHDLTV
ncbi:hypothetical protein [Roseivirga sp.]|uniref:hypothetical protein n=1 Tax=Roseivirga sp. TaxID=1964215 RepID=UPI002B27B16A|nr:hypothetical protein [Roseivirga sp.]